MHLSNQDEDSEDEPKLKYERLANGVTEILQKDAASCMTVHDKVEVISLRSTHQQHIPHCLCTHLRGPRFKIVFSLIPRAQSQCPQSILFSPFAAFPLREAHQRRFCLFSIYSLCYFFFFSILLSKVDCFERGALSVWCLTGVAPVAQMHAWAEQKSQVVTSSHLIVFFLFFFLNLYLIFIYLFLFLGFFSPL